MTRMPGKYYNSEYTALMVPVSRLKKTLHMILAVFFIALGILGLVLPIINGVVFLLIGFILLSFESPYIEEHLRRIAKKNKHIDNWYNKLDVWMRKLFRK